jgi:hypothetical protein
MEKFNADTGHALAEFSHHGDESVQGGPALIAFHEHDLDAFAGTAVNRADFADFEIA